MNWNYKEYLNNIAIERLNSMQEEFIKTAESSNNIQLLSPTGSGKTLAFLLTVIKRLQKDKNGIQALIVSPSRELAIQIEQVFKSLKTGYKVSNLIGGREYKTQANELRELPSVLIGTPGRIKDHLNKENLNLDTVSILVFDEFDKSLEFGFMSDISFIVNCMLNIKFLYLTSATDSFEMPQFFKKYNFKKLNFTKSADPLALEIKTVKTKPEEKSEQLYQLLCELQEGKTLIFCNHIEAVNRLSDFLYKKSLKHAVFHGDLVQEEREKSLIKFKNQSTLVLISSDLGARGLDIENIEHIIHYQIPEKEASFIHRNGRTARMNKSGKIFLLLSSEETMPEYLKQEPEEYHFSSQNKKPIEPHYSTLIFSGGKKNKISKTDILGFLIHQGKLQNSEIGQIEVSNFFSYAAVKSNKIKEVIENIKHQKIKNRSIKIYTE